MAADFYSENNTQLERIFSETNSDYAKQLKYFKYALLVFGIWLVAYLDWWVFLYVLPKKP